MVNLIVNISMAFRSGVGTGIWADGVSTLIQLYIVLFFVTTKHYFFITNEELLSLSSSRKYIFKKMNGKDSAVCKYYNNKQFISLNLNQRQNLNIFMNIRSLSKHAGELICYFSHSSIIVTILEKPCP